MSQIGPDKDHEPFRENYDPGKLTDDQVIKVNQISEEFYSSKFGKRPVTIHLCNREACSKNRWVIREKMKPYLNRFPNNKMVFLTVNLETGETTIVGWMYFRDIKKLMTMEELDLPVIRPEHFQKFPSD